MSGTSSEDIRRWVERAKADGCTHLIVVCDTFDWEDFPVYLKAKDQAHLDKELADRTQGMQKVMEVYAMHLPMEPQLMEYRANHPVMPPSA